MKQTAIESLIEALLPFIDRSKTSDIALHLMIEEHITMEKEQIINAYDTGNRKGYDEHILSAMYDLDEQYYNETFKNK